ncbi:MAG: hypothetical protein IJ344_07330 [Clostridia bacterium]|nr:hypothetical protein [Clostridia bacterium]
MKGRFGRFIFIVVTVIVVGLVRDYVLRALTMTVANLFFESTSFASYIVSSALAHFVAGILCVLPIFWNLRDNGSHKREFLAYFSEHEYSKAGVTAFIKTIKGRTLDAVVYCVAASLVLFFSYASMIFASPLVIIELILALAFTIGVYLFFDNVVRRMVYNKWEENRLHR